MAGAESAAGDASAVLVHNRSIARIASKLRQVRRAAQRGVSHSEYRYLRRRFRLRRLADSPTWTGLWDQAVGDLAANSRSLVARSRAGHAVDPEALFDSVRSKFISLAESQGVRLPRSGGKVMPIHHWNWNKGDYSSIVTDARHLFFAQPRFHNAADTGIHQFLQRAGRHPTRDPIPGRWALNVQRSFLNQ